MLQAIEQDAIHGWFGLTYANYLVLPRSVLQSMPDEWQCRFVGMLEEMRRSFGHIEWPSYEVKAVIRDEERDEDGEWNEVTHEIADPIPHYERGRTRLEPRGT